jgi:hypothetical protein
MLLYVSIYTSLLVSLYMCVIGIIFVKDYLHPKVYILCVVNVSIGVHEYVLLMYVFVFVLMFPMFLIQHISVFVFNPCHC